VKEYYDKVTIVFLPYEDTYGSIEKLGAYASMVKYVKDDEEVQELVDNEDFVIFEEIVFEHTEE
jgi:hypothetical protein